MEWFQFMLFVLACPMLSRKIHIFVGPFNAVDPEVASKKEGQRPHRELLLFPLGEGWLTIPYYVLDGRGVKGSYLWDSYFTC